MANTREVCQLCVYYCVLHLLVYLAELKGFWQQSDELC